MVKLDDIQLHTSIAVKMFVVFNPTDLNGIVGRDKAAKDDKPKLLQVSGFLLVLYL